MNKETQNKLVWNAIPTLFDVPNPPSKVAPSRQVKMGSVSSAVKKAPSKDPIEIFQDLPSTSKETHVCDTPQKKKTKM